MRGLIRKRGATAATGDGTRDRAPRCGLRPVWLALAAIVPAQIAVTWTPLGAMDAGLILAVGLGFFLVLEAEKPVRLRLAGAGRPAGH